MQAVTTRAATLLATVLNDSLVAASDGETSYVLPPNRSYYPDGPPPLDGAASELETLLRQQSPLSLDDESWSVCVDALGRVGTASSAKDMAAGWKQWMADQFMTADLVEAVERAGEQQEDALDAAKRAVFTVLLAPLMDSELA
jgi:hypothetical protein